MLASMALDTGIIHESFYTSLVMLALITLVLAGSRLQVALRRNAGQLLDDDERRPQQLLRPA